MDLRDRACILAGVILEIGEVALAGTRRALAEQTLADGSAWKKFQRICDAQGGMRTPPTARLTHRSEEHTSELQSLMRISYAVFCLTNKNNTTNQRLHT